MRAKYFSMRAGMLGERRNKQKLMTQIGAKKGKLQYQNIWMISFYRIEEFKAELAHEEVLSVFSPIVRHHAFSQRTKHFISISFLFCTSHYHNFCYEPCILAPSIGFYIMEYCVCNGYQINKNFTFLLSCALKGDLAL